MKHKDLCYENRYKHKLNMLEPGIVMMKIMGGLFAFGVLFWLIGRVLLSTIILFLAGAVLAVLLTLLIIEAHQDKVLNDIAMLENIESEKKL